MSKAEQVARQIEAREEFACRERQIAARKRAAAIRQGAKLALKEKQ